MGNIEKPLIGPEDKKCHAKVDTQPAEEKLKEVLNEEELPTAVEVEEAFSRSVPDEYHNLIKGDSRFVMSRQPYADDLQNFFDPTSDKFNPKLEILLKPYVTGKTFVDLGCGYSSFSRRFCKHFGLGGYIGVDIQLKYRQKRFMEQGALNKPSVIIPDKAWGYNDDTLPCLFVHGDILELLARIQQEDNHVILLSGIQEGDESEQCDEYCQKLWQEISRISGTDDLLMVGSTWGTRLPGYRDIEEVYGFRHFDELHENLENRSGYTLWTKKA